MSKETVKKRKNPKIFAVQVIIMLTVMYVAGNYIGSRFKIGIDDQQTHCLPFKYYLIDMGDKSIPRDGYLAFRSDSRMAPWYEEGTLFIKQARAVGGDSIRLRDGRVFVNDAHAGDLDPDILKKLQKKPEELSREGEVPSESVWAMGTSLDSFDSRYWGYVRSDQVAGQVYPLF